MWDERKHPRDPDSGEFVEKGVAISERTRYNIGRLLRSATERRKGFVDIQLFAEKHSGENVRNLPPIVLARFYDRLGNIRHGEYYEITPTGARKVTIDDDNGYLYDITYTGTFGEPQIEKVISYSHDKAGRKGNDTKKTRAKYDKKKKD